MRRVEVERLVETRPELTVRGGVVETRGAPAATGCDVTCPVGASICLRSTSRVSAILRMGREMLTWPHSLPRHRGSGPEGQSGRFSRNRGVRR